MDHWQPANEHVRKLETEERIRGFRAERETFVGITAAVAFWASWVFAPLWLTVAIGIVAVVGLIAAVVRRVRENRAAAKHEKLQGRGGQDAV